MIRIWTPKLSRSRADLLFVYLAYALRYVYLLILTPFYGRVLGVEGYAFVLASMSLMSVVWLFVSWGFATSGMREIATMLPSQYSQLFGQQFVARVLLSFVGLVGGLVAISASPTLSAQPIASLCAVVLGIISAFNLGWYFIGSGRPRDAVKLEVLGFVVSLTLILTLVRSPDDAGLVLASLLLSGVIALVIAHWWIRPEISALRFDLRNGAELIRTSSTFFLYSGSSVLLMASSTYILSLLSTQTEVGHFGAAERLVGVGLSVMVPVGQIFVPQITSMFARQEAHAAYGLVRKAMIILVSIGLCGLITTFLFGSWIVQLLFGPGFEASVPVLKCLAIVFPINAITLVLGGYVLVPLHKERVLAKAALLGGAISMIISVPLGGAYGGMGMAYARIFGELLVVMGLIYSTWRMSILTHLFKIRNLE